MTRSARPFAMLASRLARSSGTRCDRSRKQSKKSAEGTLTMSKKFCQQEATAFCGLEALEDTGGAHAAADAHGDEAVAGVAALQFANDGCGELRASAAQRMADGHGAAIDVDARRIEARDFDDGKRRRGEGFIQVNHMDLL